MLFCVGQALSAGFQTGFGTAVLEDDDQHFRPVCVRHLGDEPFDECQLPCLSGQSHTLIEVAGHADGERLRRECLDQNDLGTLDGRNVDRPLGRVQGGFDLAIGQRLLGEPVVHLGSLRGNLVSD